jgi:hypothetical protein
VDENARRSRATVRSSARCDEASLVLNSGLGCVLRCGYAYGAGGGGQNPGSQLAWAGRHDGPFICLQQLGHTLDPQQAALLAAQSRWGRSSTLADGMTSLSSSITWQRSGDGFAGRGLWVSDAPRQDTVGAPEKLGAVKNDARQTLGWTPGIRRSSRDSSSAPGAR